MAKRLLMVWIIGLAGCTSTQFAALSPGTVKVQGLTVEAADASWNKAPRMLTPHLHKGSQLWTRDGPLLDYMVLIPDVEDGETLFKSRSKSLVYPSYRKGMLPNEIIEVVESSLAKLSGNNVVVTSAGLRPYKLGNQRALMFDLELVDAEGPRRKGRAVIFVEDEQLYVMMYVATSLYYFDKHWESALATMNSAKIAG